MKAAIIGHGKMGREIEKILLERACVSGPSSTRRNALNWTPHTWSASSQHWSSRPPTRRMAASGRASTQGFRSSAARRAGQIVWRSAAIAGKRRCTLLRLERYCPRRQPDVPPNRRLARMMERFGIRRTDRADSPHPEKGRSERHGHHAGRRDHQRNRAQDGLGERESATIPRKSSSPPREGTVRVHTVTYESDDDRIELKHTIKNRRTLALGAVIAEVSLRQKGCLYDGRPAEINDTEHGKNQNFLPQQMGDSPGKHSIHSGSSLDERLVLLLGEIVIFDLYITRYFYKYVWRHNAEMCKKSKSYKAVYDR